MLGEARKAWLYKQGQQACDIKKLAEKIEFSISGTIRGNEETKQTKEITQEWMDKLYMEVIKLRQEREDR